MEFKSQLKELKQYKSNYVNFLTLIQHTPRPGDTKCKLSDISMTPMSAEKETKQSKQGSPDGYE